MSNKPFIKEQPINVFSEITQKFFPYWPVFLLATSIAFAIAFVKLRYSTPMYRANASIMLKDEEKGVESVINALEGTTTKKNVENEIEILKSRKLMTRVIKDLNLYAQVFMPGRVRHLYAYNNSPVSFVAIKPELVNGSELIDFKFLPKEQSIELMGVKYPLEDTANTPFGKFKLNYNSKYDAGVNKLYMVKFSNIEGLTKEFLGHLHVGAGGKQSTILNLIFTDAVPERAKDILNHLIEVYNEAGVEDKNTMATNTLEFIENRLALITMELSSIEGNIESYKSAEGIVDISTQGTAYLTGVQNYDLQLSEVKIQLSVLEQIENYVINKSDNPGTVPSTLGISDPILMQLLNKLSDAELQLNKLKRTTAENSPALLSLQSQIAQLKPSILENIRNVKRNLQATEAKIQSETNKYSSLLRQIPKRERKLLDIQRQQVVKENIYTFLLEKREETALSYASSAPDSRMVNDAEVTSFPVSPVKTSMYLLALISGVMVGVVFVLLKEVYVKQVMFRSEIEKATSAQIIAEIMHKKEKGSIAINEGKRTPIAEQFRSLRTSLNFIGNSDAKNKTILVTSSVSGDGKSFISLNLAISLALTTKKVLLIDLDFRKPKIASMLDMDKDSGMVNILAGNLNPDKVIRQIKGIQNLHIITAGGIPPNPTELLLNDRFDKILHEFKEQFDYIIFDSPPLGLVTDAKILQKHTDVNLYVVRHHHTPKSYLRYIEQVNTGSEFNNLYVVFNDIKNRGIFGSKNQQGFGYGYGYGYGYGNEEALEHTGFKAKLKKIFGSKKSKNKKV